MNHLFASFACVALSLTAAASVRAWQAPTEKGRVLVFLSERTLSGDIERVGDHYRVRRLIGETLIPADQVLKLCGSLEEAYQALRGRANLNDPDERHVWANGAANMVYVPRPSRRSARRLINGRMTNVSSVY